MICRLHTWTAAYTLLDTMPITELGVERGKRPSRWIRRLAWLQRLSGRAIGFLYIKTGGKLGGTVRGMPVLLLTTTGRRTGLERTTPLIYIRHSGTYVVAASAAAADRDPDWYHNLKANPAATIQVESSRIEVTARVAEQEERNYLYQRFKAGSDAFRTFEESTVRIIPVIVLHPDTEHNKRGMGGHNDPDTADENLSQGSCP